MDNMIDRELDKLLSESLSDCIKRENSTFDVLAGNTNSGIILFGSGGLGRRTLQGLRKINITPLCFCDNNEHLWDTSVDGLMILSPQNAIRKYPDATFVLCIWSDKVGHPLEDVEKQLNEFKKTIVVSFSFLFWKYPDVFLPYFRLDLPHKTLKQFDLVSSALSLWENEESRLEYLAQIRWRLFSDFKGLSAPVKSPQYFPEDLLRLTPDEVFIDCGAFDGDTLDYFISTYRESFGKYHAFEPDPINFKRLNDYVSDLKPELKNKISIKQLAIGNRKEKLFFDASGNIQATVSDKGTILVDCNTLDEILLRDVKPTFIKMDDEGFEPNIIIGAKKVIEKYTPIIAVAIYHEYDHLWRIPLSINAISNKYKFYLKPHFNAGWELVFYAIPESRAI
jgi:FkbM family methyltransferase